MRINYGLICLLVLFSLVAFKAPNKGFVWAKQTQDVGKIEQGKPIALKYEFKNLGNKPMIITRVKTSCGCTATEWPKEPINVGESSAIKVNYNAATLGNFNKTITVFTDQEEQTYVLGIRGEVISSTKSKSF